MAMLVYQRVFFLASLKFVVKCSNSSLQQRFRWKETLRESRFFGTREVSRQKKGAARDNWNIFETISEMVKWWWQLQRFFIFNPDKRGKMNPIWWAYFVRWVGSTTNQEMVNIFLFSWLVGSHNHFTRRWTIESAPKNALSLEGSGGSVQFLLAIHVFFVFGTSLCYHNSSFLFQSGVPNYLLKRAAARVLEKNRIGESQIIWKNHLRVQMVGFFIARHLCQISIKRWDSFGGRQGRLPGVYPGYLGISTRGSFPFAFAVRLMLPWEVISMRLREVGGLWILGFAVTTFFFLVVGWCL